MLEAEADLLHALDRLSSAASDAAWQEAVTARDKALRRLLIAVSDMPINEQEHVVTRATQALAREQPPPPGPDAKYGGVR